MSFFNLFVSKNPDYLKNKDEKEAAELFKTILISYQNNDPNYIPNGVSKLSVGIYYLAFRRTNKKVVPIENLTDISAIFNRDYKGVHYAGVLKAIKQTIEKTCENPAMMRSIITSQDCQTGTLSLLKTATKRLLEIS